MSKFIMPPEWAPHEQCWMAWPLAEHTFGDTLPVVREEYAAVARAIAQFEPVSMLYDPDNCLGIDELRGVAGIELVECPLDDSWLRDNGPTFVVDENGKLAGVDWEFDGWGGDWPHAKDRVVAAKIIERVGAERRPSSLNFEGGALNVDDRGTIVVTRQCYEHRTRNGGPSMEEFEQEVCGQLGMSKMIWLNRTLENDSTNGHVDVIAAFVPGGVLCQISGDPNDPDYQNCLDNYEILKSETDAKGEPLEVHTVTGPPVSYKADGSRRFISYINFYVVNGGVVVPQYGFPQHDREAIEVLSKLFPDRKVVGVMTNTIADGGGNIHCITQQQPKVGEGNA